MRPGASATGSCRAHDGELASVVAPGRHLPDLPAVVRGLRRRRHRRPAGDHGASRPPHRPRRGGDLAVAVLPLADGGLRLRRRRLLRRRPRVRHARGLRRPGRGGPSPRDQGRRRLRPEPHVRPASVVPRCADRAGERQARLVRVARGTQRRSSEQLALLVQGGRPGVDEGRAQRRVVPALLPPPAARPQLGQPGGGGGDARRPALLVRARASTASGSTSSTSSRRTPSCATRFPASPSRTRTGSR